MPVQGVIPGCSGKNLAPEDSDSPKVAGETWNSLWRLRRILPFKEQRRLHSERRHFRQHHLNTEWLWPSEEPGKAPASINVIEEIVELELPMIYNKMTKTQTDPIAVNHNKHEISKTKIVDYQERNFVSLTKPVGETHISSFMCLGKKNKKKQKKQKKDKKNKKRYKTN